MRSVPECRSRNRLELATGGIDLPGRTSLSTGRLWRDSRFARPKHGSAGNGRVSGIFFASVCRESDLNLCNRHAGATKTPIASLTGPTRDMRGRRKLPRFLNRSIIPPNHLPGIASKSFAARILLFYRGMAARRGRCGGLCMGAMRPGDLLSPKSIGLTVGSCHSSDTSVLSPELTQW